MIDIKIFATAYIIEEFKIFELIHLIWNYHSRKAIPLGDIKRSSCGEGDIRRPCSSVG